MPRRPRERGFSLPELLVVIAIIGTFAMFAIPAFRDFLQAFKVKTSATQVQGIFRLGRQMAVARKARVIVEIYGTQETYDAAVDANLNDSIDAGEDKVRPITPLAQGVNLVNASSGTNTWEDAKFRLNSDGTIQRVGAAGTETGWDVLLSRLVNRTRTDEWRVQMSRAGKVKLQYTRVRS